MRVTILSRDFPPTTGGIADHTDLLAAELARHGLTVTVVTSARAVEERAAFVVRPQIQRWDARGNAEIEAAVAQTNADVIFWQYSPFSIGRHGLAPAAGRLARALGSHAPLVVFFHELWFPWGRQGLRGAVWAVGQRVQGRSVLRAARGWIVTTERRETEVRRYLKRGHLLRRIPIASTIEPKSSHGNARRDLGIAQSAFVVAHLGGVGPGRDLGPAYEAVARLRTSGLDAHLVLAGHTGPFVKPEALNGALHTTGTVTREQLSAVLASSDAYVHCDRAGASAGRRTTLMAALAHGLPVVAYRGPDSAPQLVDGENVILVAPDADDIAVALRGLIEDPERARRIGHAARGTYATSFAWNRIGESLVDLLRECAR